MGRLVLFGGTLFALVFERGGSSPPRFMSLGPPARSVRSLEDGSESGRPGEFGKATQQIGSDGEVSFLPSHARQPCGELKIKGDHLLVSLLGNRWHWFGLANIFICQGHLF